MHVPAKYASLSVLVVDDSEPMRLLLWSMLRAFDVGTIHAVGSGREAIQFLRFNVPDIVLVDWMMEGMTGMELAMHIRRSPESLNPYVPIVMITGHGDKLTVVEARNAGVHEFLVKPLSAVALAERLASIVDNPRGFVRTKTYFGPDRRRHQAPGQRRERRRTDIEVIPPEQIADFIAQVRAMMADGPIARVNERKTAQS